MSETVAKDIISINNDIILQFEKRRETLGELKKKYSELKKTRKRLYDDKKCMVSSRIIKEVDMNMKRLETEIEDIESGKEQNFYISETIDLLQRYSAILKTPVKMNFMGKSKEENSEKEIIVKNFMNIAEKYILDKSTEKKKKKKPSTVQKNKLYCNACPNKKDFVIEDNTQICTICGSVQEIIQNFTSYSDGDRVNISTKYTYDRKVHFRDCINQYQGKQNCNIDQKIYDELEDIFERHHLLVGDKDTPRDVRFSKITKEHILMFLKELDYSKQYENVTLIHSNMTGKKPDDISYLEDKLLTDFDTLVDTYDKHFKTKVDRINFISTQYVLFQLLQKYKHPCKKEDFVILKTMDRKAFHDNVYKELCTILGWNFTPLY